MNTLLIGIALRAQLLVQSTVEAQVDQRKEVQNLNARCQQI